MSLLIDAALAARHPRKPKNPMPVPAPTVPGDNGDNGPSTEPGCPVDGFVAARRSKKSSEPTHKTMIDTVDLSAAMRGKKHTRKA